MQYCGVNYKPVKVNDDGSIDKCASCRPKVKVDNTKATSAEDNKAKVPKEEKEQDPNSPVEATDGNAEATSSKSSPSVETAPSTPPPALERSSPLPSPAISSPPSPRQSTPDAMHDGGANVQKMDMVSNAEPHAASAPIRPKPLVKPPPAVAAAASSIRPKKRQPSRRSRNGGGREAPPSKKIKDERNVCINPVTMMRLNAATYNAPQSSIPVQSTEMIASTPYSDHDDNSVEIVKSVIRHIEEEKAAAPAATDNTDEDLDEVQFCGCSYHYMAHLNREELNQIEAVRPPSPPPSIGIPEAAYSYDSSNFTTTTPAAKHITPSTSSDPLCSRCCPRTIPPPAILSSPNLPGIGKPMILPRSSSNVISDDEGESDDHHYVEPKRTSRDDEMDHFFEDLGLPFDEFEDIAHELVLEDDLALGDALEKMVEEN